MNAVFYGELLYNATNSYTDAVIYARALYTNTEYKRCAVFLERIVGLVPTPSSPLCSLLETDLHRQNQTYQKISPNLVLQATMLACLSYMQLLEYEEAQSLMDYTTAYLIKTVAGIDDHCIKQLLLDEVPFAKHECEDPPPLGHQQQQNQSKIPPKMSLHPVIIQISSLVQQHAQISIKENCGTIHPMAQFSTLRGRIYDALGNSHKASVWLQASLHIDVFCIEAFHLLIERNLLSTLEQWALIDTLHFDSASIEDSNLAYNRKIGTEKLWLRDLMISRLHCSSPNARNRETKQHQLDKDTSHQNKYTTASSCFNNLTTFSLNQTIISQRDPSSNMFLDILSPGSSIKDISAIHHEHTPVLGQTKNSDQSQLQEEIIVDNNKIQDIQDVDLAFIRLTTTYSGPTQKVFPKSNEDNGQKEHGASFNVDAVHAPFQRSTTVLAYAARRALLCHALHVAASFCAEIYSLDPLCPYVLYTHIVTLAGLKRKRELFYLAHQLVQANPKAASSWFAVGCYYYICGRYDVAQRHFCRATRLQPKCTESWIAFGNSFAMADESDQALAAYRAAQRCDSGNTHMPFLQMGMEYLRTSHLTLARHFFECAMNRNPDDPLPASELGVCAYKHGQYEEAVAWSLQAMYLREKLEQRMSLLCQVHSKSVADEISAPFLQSSLESNTSVFAEEPLSCILSCRDPYWEPTISNLGHSYRKLRSYEKAVVCYEVALRLCPSNSSNYTSLGLTKQFLGDVDGAIDLYHRALTIKSDDNLAGDMLTRALRETLGRPQTSSEKNTRGISTVDLNSGVCDSFGSTTLSRHGCLAPLISGRYMIRPSNPHERSIADKAD